MRTIDADALIKKFWEGLEDGTITGPEDTEGLICAAPTVKTCKWTKVENALPERDGIYLTVFNFPTWGEEKKKYPLTCRYSVAAKHFFADGPVIGEISHWMEIPELEEEKNENQTDSRADKEAEMRDAVSG